MKFNIPILPITISINRKITPPVTRIRRDYNKVFVIGFNKTGTTSMYHLLKDFGFKLGDQTTAEMLTLDLKSDHFLDRLVRYCKTADAFQDIPFSMRHLYKDLDAAFPGSKFILTVRDNGEQWFNSVRSFHTKKFSSDPSRPPTINDLRSSLYRYEGFPYDVIQLQHNIPEDKMYVMEEYVSRYENHIGEVEKYFAGREKDLLKINVGKDEDFTRLTNFLQIETDIKGFPWKKKTKEIK
ncbi:MAG: hypothetical protein K9I69_02815 [Ignavibacteriales bacterium]|nr:hypothetical protein [Ignavibacteriales bacterium]MCF8315107.1 hypothetical protein [Ignavibacteriales bacterium]MCF8435897.1 hypothetical protein [Ignavibacteriales bacterium]